MLHYDMVRYEVMYLRTLDQLLNTDHSSLYNRYDTPQQYQGLISLILENNFFGDQERIKNARKDLKLWADMQLIDREYFECFRGTPRATWFAHHYIFEYPVIPGELRLAGLGNTVADTQRYNSLLNDTTDTLKYNSLLNPVTHSPEYNSLLMEKSPSTNQSNSSLGIDVDSLNPDSILKLGIESPKKSKRSFSRLYSNEGASVDLYNPSPVTERERINGVMKYIDLAAGTLGNKIDYFRKLHDRWLDQYDFFLRDFEWMSRDDENQLLYLWDYLKNKNRIADYLRPYNTSMRYDMIIAAIDVWNVLPDEKLEFIEKMKHAWQASKSYRKSKK